MWGEIYFDENLQDWARKGDRIYHDKKLDEWINESEQKREVFIWNILLPFRFVINLLAWPLIIILYPIYRIIYPFFHRKEINAAKVWSLGLAYRVYHEKPLTFINYLKRCK